MGYSVVHIDDIEGFGPDGALKVVRRALGGASFGVDWFDVPPNTEGVRHDETASGQEEVNVVVRGSGVYRIDDGEEVPFTAGSVFRFGPETTRQPVAGPDGFSMVAIGPF